MQIKQSIIYCNGKDTGSELGELAGTWASRGPRMTRPLWKQPLEEGSHPGAVTTAMPCITVSLPQKFVPNAFLPKMRLVF